ncbi:MAG: response regulator [Solirubrobacteraceae bacterium]|jgi:CheY-like chemotaxis protein
MTYRVLIADDNDQVRALIAAVLGSEGYELRHAAHGQAILDDLARRAPDLVILDLHMPGIDGLGVLTVIRSDPALAATRVLMLSGDTAALDADWSAQIGADAHLAKPFELSALTDTVRFLLER